MNYMQYDNSIAFRETMYTWDYPNWKPKDMISVVDSISKEIPYKDYDIKGASNVRRTVDTWNEV